VSRRYERIANYSDMPEITVKQIEHFFSHYKDLEPGKWAKLHHWGDAAESRRLIELAVARAKATEKKGT
jgi:inorganic pyrophosphatase